MDGSDMPLQSLVLPEALAATLIIPTPKALGAFVDGGMTTEPSGRDERLPAVGHLTCVLLLMGMRAFDVLSKVLLLEIIFPASLIGAAERPVVGMRSEVGGQAGRPVERLVTPGKCARYRLQIGRELSRDSRGGRDGRCRGGLGRADDRRIGAVGRREH